MVSHLLINLIFFVAHNAGDSIPMFRKEVEKLERYIGPPPEYYASDTCFHYSGVLKIEINKSSKVVSYVVSDGSPLWIKEDIKRSIERKYIKLTKLDSLAAKEGIKNSIIIFPLIFETIGSFCKEEIKTGVLNENYFHFDGKNIKGNIRFENPIYFVFYKGKGDHDTNYQLMRPKVNSPLNQKN